MAASDKPDLESAFSPPDPQSGGRVLLVDENEASIALLAFDLAKAGYRVEGGHTAAERVKAA